MSAEGLIDWSLAESVARSVAGRGSGRRSIRRPDLARASRGSSGLVRRYTGLEPRGRLPSPELVDRHEWIEANLSSLRSMSAAFEDRLAESLDLPGALGAALR
ncbi:MAG: zinc-dependent metalloprotease, partial [Gaiellaceae bacterium]